MEISRKMVKIFDLSEHTGLLWIKTVHLETTTYILCIWIGWILKIIKKSGRVLNFDVLYSQMFIPNFFFI